MITITFLEMILGMRPDETYQIVLNGMSQNFEEYRHLFKITHTQSPQANALEKVSGVIPPDSILGMKVARATLYEKVTETMHKSGMSKKEIERTSFHMVTKTNKYNPLLS